MHEKYDLITSKKSREKKSSFFQYLDTTKTYKMFIDIILKPSTPHHSSRKGGWWWRPEQCIVWLVSEMRGQQLATSYIASTSDKSDQIIQSLCLPAKAEIKTNSVF